MERGLRARRGRLMGGGMGFFHQPGPVCKAARLAFSGSNTHLKAYTRRKRKETLDEIMKPGRTINNTLAKQLPATLVQPAAGRWKPGYNDTVWSPHITPQQCHPVFCQTTLINRWSVQCRNDQMMRV